MADKYFRKILKRNWKLIVFGSITLIIIGIIVKNVGEIPYENQHLMNTTLPLRFEYQGNEINGFLYVSYWVETNPEEIKNMTEQDLDDYLSEHSQLYLEPIKDKIIAELKTYPLEDMKKNWYTDYQYFKTRNIYFIKNDPRLEKFLKKQDFNLDLPFSLKKVFFVYLNKEKYKEFKTQN